MDSLRDAFRFLPLLWITVFNFYYGLRESDTHPEGYDRLYQVLDQVVEEGSMVWIFVAYMLRIHMWHAGFKFSAGEDSQYQQADPKDWGNWLIVRISKNQFE